MKKILVLLLIFIMSFTMFACGNNDETPDDQEQNSVTVQQDDDDQSSQEGEGEDEPEKLNPDELVMSDDMYGEEYGEEYSEMDMGLKAEPDFALAGTVAKVGYDDISSMGGIMDQMLSDSLAAALGDNFTTFGEFEEYEGDEIDLLAYAVGMEDNDTDKRYIESGVYHNSTDDKNYQYCILTSDTYYELSTAAINEALKELEEAFGITASGKKVEAAAKAAVKEAEETEYFSAAYEEIQLKQSGYTEVITLSVEAMALEEGGVCYYLAVERERCYE